MILNPLNREYQEKSKEMYRELTHAIMIMQSEYGTHKTERFPGLDTMTVLGAPVRLGLPELKWLESQTWRLRRILLDQTDVLENERTASVLMTVEMILEKVLSAFAEKYLDWDDKSKLSFLTADKGVFDNGE